MEPRLSTVLTGLQGWGEFFVAIRGGFRKVTFEARLSHRSQTTVNTKHDRLGYAHKDILPFAWLRSTMPNDAAFPIENGTYRVITQSPDATNFRWRVMPLFIEPLIPRADPLRRNAGEAATAAPTLPCSELLRAKSADEGVTILFGFRHALRPCSKDNSVRRFCDRMSRWHCGFYYDQTQACLRGGNEISLLRLVERIASSDRTVV